MVFRESPRPAVPAEEVPTPPVEVGGEVPEEALGRSDITRVGTEVVEDATLVTIEGTAPIQYMAFRLSDPPRLVLDLSNVRYTTASGVEEVQKGLVRGVNLSRIFDRDITRLEIVLESLHSYDIAREGNSLEITLRGKAPEVAEVGAGGLAEETHRISDVSYYRAGTNWRIVVEVEGNEPRFDVLRLEDPLRLCVDLEETVVPKDLQGVQVVDDPASVVANVSTFQFKQEPNPRARIIAQLNEFTPYIVYQVGNSIYLDFESPLGALAEAAPEAAGKQVVGEPQVAAPVVPEAPVELGPIPGAAGRYTGRKISLDFQDADVNDVLRLLAEISGYNIITSPDVGGNINISMKEVPWDQALEIILRMAQLDQYREGNILMVDTIENIQRLREEKEAQAPAPVVATRGVVEGQVTAAEPGTVKAGQAPSAPAPLSMVTRYFTLNYISTDRSGTGAITAAQTTISTTDSFQLWGILDAEIRKLMSLTDQDDRIMVNPTAGLIRVTDYPENLERIGEFLEIIESTLLQQVLIEANILEVSLREDSQLGVDWTYVGDFLQGKGVRGALEGGAIFDQSLGLGSPFRFGITSADFRIIVDALSTQGTTRSISNPRISTLNNQKAVINVGTREVYFEGTVQLVGTTGQTITTYTPQYIDVGLVLDVTPRIDLGAGFITMDVHPSVTSIVRFETSPPTETGARSTAPVVGVRETDTVIKVEEGQTVIIAGLIERFNQNLEAGVPYLRSIPILGRLFRQEEKRKTSSEMVILLKPTVVREVRLEEITQRDIDLIREMRREFSEEAL